MSKLLEKRRLLLKAAKNLTLDKGCFTLNDLSRELKLPRSTLQDWINRFLEEKCLAKIENGRGRSPSKFVRAAKLLPASACRRIFSTADGENVEIFHECRSSGCIAFCNFAYSVAGGIITHVGRDGLLLRCKSKRGFSGIAIGNFPRSSVGIEQIKIEDGNVVQRIKCFGGPAFSLTEMMKEARGVQDLRISKRGDFIEGEIVTKALVHVTIAVDDSDSEEEGATFALALSLLDRLDSMDYVEAISHKVGFLNPRIRHKTAGNAVSFIELGVYPENVQAVIKNAVSYIGKETHSDRTAMAIKLGLEVDSRLKALATEARRRHVTADEARRVAKACDIQVIEVSGELGIVGAVAAIGMADSKPEVLMDPRKKIA